MKTRFVCAVSLIALACAANPSPVPVVGTADDLRALAGEWSGAYKSAETDRAGSITFTLTAGRDTAFGDVVMVPGEPNLPGPAEVATAHGGMQRGLQMLTIRFVRVNGRLITGTILPYESPDCECTLLTTFRGQLRGDRISGDFMITHSDDGHALQKGTWWAARKVTTAR